MQLSLSIRARLEFQHLSITELIQGYSEEQLRHRKTSDKWSVLENIAHLVTYQRVFDSRMKKILEGNTPFIERYVAEDDSLFFIYLAKSLVELLHDMHDQRISIYQQLCILDARQLAYTGLHALYGRLTLVQWSEFFLLHEAHHLFTRFKLMNTTPEGAGC